MDLSLAGTLPAAQFKPSPRQEFEAGILDRLWTDRRQRQRAQWRGASGIPGKQAVGYRPASASPSKMAEAGRNS